MVCEVSVQRVDASRLIKAGCDMNTVGTFHSLFDPRATAQLFTTNNVVVWLLFSNFPTFTFNDTMIFLLPVQSHMLFLYLNSHQMDIISGFAGEIDWRFLPTCPVGCPRRRLSGRSSSKLAVIWSYVTFRSHFDAFSTTDGSTCRDEQSDGLHPSTSVPTYKPKHFIN